MGDHLVLLVDRLLTESTLEAAIQSNNQLQRVSSSVSDDMIANSSPYRMDTAAGSSPRKLVECKICHDEDEDSNMEIPCSCSGSLKYAHRRCVQRWCNEKGDTNCEICLQHFKPGYSAPHPLSRYGRIPLNFRGSWEVSGRNLPNTEFIAMVSMDHQLMDSDIDEYSSHSSRSLICCRIVAIIFVALLVLRHTLPIIISDAGQYSITTFLLLALRITGVILPVFLIVKHLLLSTASGANRILETSLKPYMNEENLFTTQHPKPHLIQLM